jgi:cytochrome P450
MRDMAAYLRDFVPHRRANPGNSITDQLIASMDQPSDQAPVTVDELIANLMVLLIAGHETTANMISCGMLRLLQHPEQLADLRAGMADPNCVENAVEEILRYDSPLSNVPRTAVAEIELHGKKIRAGQRVYLANLAANRDPTVFPDPDRFDIRRENAGKHIAFAFGIHFCIGAPLARMEGQIAFPALLRRFPNIRLSDKSPEWADALTLHGLITLPVVVS